MSTANNDIRPKRIMSKTAAICDYITQCCCDSCDD